MTWAGASILPLVFGPTRRRLFGIFHPTSAPATPRAGVVLCTTFGQEAIRAQRMMRVLAERLASNGHPVLRFDYFGTGDSSGDDLDADLVGWGGDLIEADRKLRSLSDASTTTWLGMRLGATIALMAAASAPSSLARLVLWDPILDGSRYLEHLRQRHVATLEAAFSLPHRPSFAEEGRDPTRFCDEAIGFALPAALRDQLRQLNPETLRWPARPPSIVALTDPGDTDGADLVLACARNPSRVATTNLSHRTPWTADTAGNTSLVPAQALMQLVQLAEASE